MPVLDDQGRLFGRLNVIDATIVAFLLLLMPIVYTAARLFGVPKPVIERVEPTSQLDGPDRLLRIVGRNLRPYLRVVASPTGYPSLVAPSQVNVPPAALLLASPSLLEIRLPALRPGTYDLRLFDSTHEVARLTSAFTLTAPPEKRTIEKQAVARARVRFSVLPETATLVRQGDSAVTEPVVPAAGGKPVVRPQPAAIIKSVRIVLDSLPPNVDFGGGWGAKLIEADVEIPVRQNAKGEWQYRQEIIRIGEQLNFQTTRYAMRGIIGELRVSSIVDVEQAASEVK